MKMRNNVIGNNFKSNIFEGFWIFENNKIGDNFTGNGNKTPIGTGLEFQNNQIGDYFSDNRISFNIRENTIGDNFKSNIIGFHDNGESIFSGMMSKNIIGNNFKTNYTEKTDGIQFYNNTIEDNFENFTIKEEHEFAGRINGKHLFLYHSWATNIVELLNPEVIKGVEYYKIDILNAQAQWEKNTYIENISKSLLEDPYDHEYKNVNIYFSNFSESFILPRENLSDKKVIREIRLPSGDIILFSFYFEEYGNNDKYYKPKLSFFVPKTIIDDMPNQGGGEPLEKQQIAVNSFLLDLLVPGGSSSVPKVYNIIIEFVQGPKWEGE